MSDNASQHFQSQQPASNGVKPEGRSLTLSITLHPNGSVDYSLPTNKILAYGMLSMAHEQLTKMTILAEAQQATAARGGMAGLLKRMQGG